MIHADGKYEKRKKTRILTIILTFENCDMWVDFVIPLEPHYASYDCSNEFQTTGKGFLDLAKLSQPFSWRLINFETGFNENEFLNNFNHTNP